MCVERKMLDPSVGGGSAVGDGCGRGDFRGEDLARAGAAEKNTRPMISWCDRFHY
ncbi:unnamed protein product, partial [Ectocarpus sp. 6 AP-2014]